jgi:exodeoxyribonuclease V alpha subunit
VDNSVENLVDNSEDNRVENKQDLESQVPQWIETWSKYILTQYSTASGLDEQALELVQEILLATTQGDSCISAEAQNTALLKPLIVTHDIEEPDIVEHGLAETVVAPFVQQHGLIYLYRYWQLERRLAIQVARLKQQKIQHVDVVAFDRFSPDPHQKLL